jgi:hypothetical protein
MISVDFELAHRQANSLRLYADGLYAASKRLSQAALELSGCWNGETAAGYTNKLELFTELLKSEAEQVLLASDVFLSKIQIYEGVEQQAIEIIETEGAV